MSEEGVAWMEGLMAKWGKRRRDGKKGEGPGMEGKRDEGKRRVQGGVRKRGMANVSRMEVWHNGRRQGWRGGGRGRGGGGRGQVSLVLFSFHYED